MGNIDEYKDFYLDKWFHGGMKVEILDKIKRHPYLVHERSAVFLKNIIAVTNSKPCPWLAFPWYDDNGQYVDSDEIEDENEKNIFFKKWSNKFNQDELLKSFGEGGLYNLSCNGWIILNGIPGLEKLKTIFGEYSNDCTREELEGLITNALNNIDFLEWFIVPDNADADYLLFICSEKKRDWIEQLKNV